jgi:hypothetical protein
LSASLFAFISSSLLLSSRSLPMTSPSSTKSEPSSDTALNLPRVAKPRSFLLRTTVSNPFSRAERTILFLLSLLG